jgi:carbamoyl-phosphate synthase large subunit
LRKFARLSDRFGRHNMDKSSFNILVLSAGRRVELIQLLIESLNKIGLNGMIVGADASLLSPALYFADKHVVIPKVSDETYISKLVELINQYDINLVVPTIDTELLILSSNKKVIELQTKSLVVVSEESVIRLFSDKKDSISTLGNLRFNVPKSYQLNDSIPFPVFIKPRYGSSSIGALKVSNEIQLKGMMDLYGEMIIQENLIGKEFTIDCMVLKKGIPTLIVPRERILTRSGEVLQGRIVKFPILIDIAKKILSQFSFYGPITIQGILTNDVFYVIEVNPRLGGGVPMSVLAGASILEDLIRDAIGHDVEYHEDYRDGALFLRYDQSIEVKS